MPSFNVYKIGDSLGDMSVTINSVNGNIVEGTFNGNSEFPEQSGIKGKFRCRVINYVPETDSVHK